jgi:hypothetical protein
LDIQQTSIFEDLTKPKDYTNLKEIVLHFKLNQFNKEVGDVQLIYCQLTLESEAIQILVKTKGAVPTSYFNAFNENHRLSNEIEQIKKVTQGYEKVKELIDENVAIKKLAESKDQEIKKLT